MSHGKTRWRKLPACVRGGVSFQLSLDAMDRKASRVLTLLMMRVCRDGAPNPVGRRWIYGDLNRRALANAAEVPSFSGLVRCGPPYA
jgi:hypothetical protein